MVRQAALIDLLLFAVTASTIFYGNYYFVPVYEALVPGANLALAMAIAFVLAIPVYFLYGALGSAMPRAGADYVYQSRGLSVLVAFPVIIGIGVFLAFGASIGVAALQSGILMGIYPILLFGGQAGAAAAVTTPVALFVIATLVITLGALNSIGGMKWVVRVQRYAALPIYIISGIAIVIILASTNPAAFHASFDSYTGSLFGNSTIYETITNGFTPTSFSWGSTFLLAIVAVTMVDGTIFTAPLLGEVKGAGSFKGVLLAFVLATAVSVFGFFAPEFGLMQAGLGDKFLQSASQAALFGTPALPLSLNFAILTDMATNSYLLIVLASLGYIMLAYFLTAWAITAVSRFLLAASLDDLLPRAVGRTEHRTHSPIFAVVIIAVASVFFVWLQIYVPIGYGLVATLSVYGAQAIPLVTSIVAITLPFTQKEIYRASPVSKYKGLLPASGVLSLIVILAIFFELGFNPSVELVVGPLGYAILFGTIIVSVAWYFGFRAYKRRKGVDIDLAFKELPLE